ncbi:uncharacterized protein LOC119547367 [Drosophila subpulchrella]|uniref:uncharacterized protein LOC119547367 n=1 Tax=Drosophila subpulchrella TaxID=1486046 RepID=UPI0018A14CB9|nr:uncharacterized protein LOC119547367 [Drosophila subpulchrella]
MANNLITEKDQELQHKSEMDSPDMSPKADFSTGSVINEIISKSLKSEEVPLAKQPSSRISFRALARLVMMLNSNLKKGNKAGDVDYWRDLAETLGESNIRYKQVIDMQRKRIDTLEQDLRNLVNLARETQQLLAEIGAEKRASQELGHGEHAD